jgi:flagellar biosynthetic protein FlhB
MSDQTEQNRSEQPTSFKLKKAREKGTVARGTDLGFLAILVGFTGCLWFSGGAVEGQIAEIARRALISAPQVVGNPDEMLRVTGMVLTSVIRPITLIAVTLFLVVLVFELIQVGPVFSTEPLRPDFSRLSPAKGLKRLFTVRLLIETVKNVFKMAVYVTLTALLIHYVQAQLAGTIVDAKGLAEAMKSMAFRLLLLALAAAALFAVIDQFIARRDFTQRMRMSRREVRREARDREGDPRMKRKRKQLHAEFAKLSQSVRGIKGADVLITNPVHYAVALRYDNKTMTAPTVVSQGSHRFAQRLKGLAFIYGVVIVQNPELARALYRLPLGSQVPDALFKPIADIYLALRERKLQSQGKQE